MVAKKPDVIEWRVDYFDGIGDRRPCWALRTALRAAVGDAPIIFTRRSMREGGEPIALDDEASSVSTTWSARAGSSTSWTSRWAMNREHVRRVVADAHAHGARVILSYHNFAYTPGQDFLVQRFLEAERLGGDVAKVAVMPRDAADVLSLLGATTQAHAKARVPLISMSMGPLGAVTRMIGGVFGSALSFAVGAGSSAPGQMPIDDLRPSTM